MAQFGFAPTATQTFQFQPTLDGNVYNCIVTWNLWGQRWYFNLYQLNGTLVLCAPVVASPPGFDINLVKNYFDSVMIFRDSPQTFIVTP